MNRKTSNLRRTGKSKCKQTLDAFVKKAKLEHITSEGVILEDIIRPFGENSCYLKNLVLSTTNNHCGWYNSLQHEFSKPYFKKLSEFVQYEMHSQEIYPEEENIFAWMRHCTFDNIKVIIIGQDPYHQPHQAHGLSFSVPAGVALPPSLKNIYKEIAKSVDGFIIPRHGCLTSWATQGVLLLNACLTVRRGSPNSHKDKGWERFTDAVIKNISKLRSNVVFMLWGAYAKKKAELINKDKHCVLTSAHPSPLSARHGFFGCNHFKIANQYFMDHAIPTVDWASVSNVEPLVDPPRIDKL